MHPDDLPSALTLYRVPSDPERDLQPIPDIRSELEDGKPLLIGLGGGLTNVMNGEDAVEHHLRRYLLKAQGLLGGPRVVEETGVHMIGVCYDAGAQSYMNELLTQGGSRYVMRIREHASRATAEQLFRQLMQPLIPDLRDKQGEDRVHALEDLNAHLKQMTFFCYSYGADVLTALHQRLQLHMAARGYTREETRGALRNVRAVTAGDMAVIHDMPLEGWDFTSMHFYSLSDAIAMEATGIYEDGGTLRIPKEAHQRLLQLGTGENMLMLVSRLPGEGWHVNDGMYAPKGRMQAVGDFARRVLRRPVKETLADYTFHDPIGHLPSSYMDFYLSDQGSGQILLRTMLQSVLRNAVKGGGGEGSASLLAPIELIAPNQREQERYPYMGFHPGYNYPQRLSALQETATHAELQPERASEWLHTFERAFRTSSQGAAR